MNLIRENLHWILFAIAGLLIVYRIFFSRRRKMLKQLRDVDYLLYRVSRDIDSTTNEFDREMLTLIKNELLKVKKFLEEELRWNYFIL